MTTHEDVLTKTKGSYVILEEPADVDGCGASGGAWWSIWWWWARLVVVLVFAAGLVACFFLWVLPFLMEKEVIPLINWLRSTFSTQTLALLIFGSVSLFPTILLPSSPSMWVAGMIFGYGFGFLIIICGVIIGVSLPFLIGSLFSHKVQGWLENDPKRASIIRLAGEGNWLNQFRAVTLLRISPFPYIIFNYCAVVTNVKFVPYLLGSVIGTVPDILVSIYTGIMIRTIADASHDQIPLSPEQIIFTIVGFCLTVATTVLITVYAKGRLCELQKDEEQLLLQ